jgi:hypothetical protein
MVGDNLYSYPMGPRRAAGLAIALAASLTGCATLGIQTFHRWAPPGGRYSVDVPRTWEQRDQSNLPIPGLILSHRQGLDASEPAATIRLAYFPAGNSYVTGWREALQKSSPSSKVVDAVLTGRAAHVAERRFTEAYPPNGGTNIYNFRSMLVFIEDGEGFWEFQYTAVDERYNDGLAAFERLLHSLKTGT